MGKRSRLKRRRQVPAEWIGCCFECRLGPPSRPAGLWRFLDDSTAGLAPREVARRWMRGHHDQHQHRDLLIMCARRDDGSSVTALPSLLADEHSRQVLLRNLAALEAGFRQRWQLTSAESVTVRLPGGYLVEALHDAPGGASPAAATRV